MILRGEVPVTSLHRNSGYPADRIWFTVNVYHDQRQYGQPLSGLDQHFNDVVKGSVVSFNAGGARIAIPNYVWLAAVIVIIMWFIWNKTTFGKNMFAVGSNPEAAKVSGVNVMRTTILVHTLAGAMYGLTGFIESSRIGSNTANTGLNYECDAIAACVIGGVSFVGGTGKISGLYWVYSS